MAWCCCASKYSARDRFDWAFRKYIRDWAYKHPSPSDFFREMDSEGGEDLSWFWRGWYMHNWRFNLAVTKIEGDKVTIVNKGQLVLPATKRCGTRMAPQQDSVCRSRPGNPSRRLSGKAMSRSLP